ncbi:MAG: NAD-dependent epimerase/dehydratase family protein [Janthinobacterium lividum]
MNVLVTGASGFVGLALTEALLAAGKTVVAFDAAPVPAAAAALFATLPGQHRPVLGDVRDEAALIRAMVGADRMIITAAVTAGTERERAAPELVIGVNVQAVATAVRLAAAAGLRRVVHLSSGAAYGATADTPGPLTEDMPLRPSALYGITKAAGEAVALRLAELGGLDLVAVRLGACFGPWEYATGLRDTLSPQQQILLAMRAAEPVVLEADATRDWLYVRDATAGILALLDAPALTHRVYNVGTGMAWPLGAWCSALGAEWSVGPAPHVRTWNDRPSASIDRLTADTPYRPRFGAEAAAADWLDFLARVGPGSLAARD